MNDFSDLSGISNVGFNSDGFSFAKTAGSLVNNREFSRGFREWSVGRQTPAAYVWQCLSAAGDEVGDAVYAGVRDYIDRVSNVDTCGVRSLKSMADQIGLDSPLLNGLDGLPAEVADLMDIVSIDRKYLLRSDLLKCAFLADLSTAGVVTFPSADAVSGETAYFDSAYIAEMSASGSPCSVRDIAIDDGAYFGYVAGLYAQLLLGFCYMEYNQPGADGVRYYIYRTLDSSSSAEEIEDFKRLHGIEPSFDEKSAVDAIDSGLAEIGDWQSPYDELIQLEIARRAAKVTPSELEMASGGATGAAVQAGNRTRYSYYRKAKVAEYVDFVNRKYFADNTGSATEYARDPAYFQISGNAQEPVIVRDGGKIVGLDDTVISAVAGQLAVATEHVMKLRGRIKTQTRKNYMKGTQNLLLYVVNEYLNDYERKQSKSLADKRRPDGGPEYSRGEIEAVLSSFRNHRIDQLAVTEYYDETEYFNQECDSTPSALNGKLANQTFWKDGMGADGVQFSLKTISDFYRNAMEMRDVISDEVELSAFLAAVYGAGADTSHVNTQTGIFAARLSAFGGRYSSEIYPRLSALSAAFEFFKPYSEGYDYPDSPASAQLSAVLEEYIYKGLSDDYLSAVSSVYDSYISSVDAIQMSVDGIIRDFGQYLSGGDSLYFVSSDCKYSQDRGKYAHLFYVGNTKDYNATYIGDRLSEFLQYASGFDTFRKDMPTVTNWAAFDTISALSVSLGQLCSDFLGGAESTAELSLGYGRIPQQTLDAEMKECADHVQKRSDERIGYLKSQLDAVRTQANQLKTQYDQIEWGFASTVAGYDDGSPGMTFKDTSVIYEVAMGTGKWNADYSVDFTFTGFCAAKDSPTGQSDLEWMQYNTILNKYCAKVRGKDGDRAYITHTLEHKYDPDPATADLRENIEAFMEFLDTPNAFAFTHYTDDAGVKHIRKTDTVKGLMKEGAYTAASTMLKQYNDLPGTKDSLIDQLVAIGAPEADFEQLRESSGSSLTLGKKIQKLIEYATNFNEQYFYNDSVVRTCRNCLVSTASISARYVPARSDYSDFIENGAQQQYFQGGKIRQELSFQALSELSEYRARTDEDAKNRIILSANWFRSSLDAIDREYLSAVAVLNADARKFVPYDDSSCRGRVDACVSCMRDYLVEDVRLRTVSALAAINGRKYAFQNPELTGCVDIMSAEISARLAEISPAEDIIADRVSELNFFDDPQYIEKTRLFREYGNILSARYPYYNLTNGAHPSYQVHPYLWNFIEKDAAQLDSMTKTVFSAADMALESSGERFLNVIRGRYGEFGQALGAWECPNRVDFSGYTTRYEASEHKSVGTGKAGYPVDYDGFAYPPAVKDLKEYAASDGGLARCVNSMLSGVDFDRKRSIIGAALDENVFADGLSNHIVIEWLSSASGGLEPAYVGDIDIAATVETAVSAFLPSVDVALAVDQYLSEAISSNGLSVNRTLFFDYIASRVPETFYGKYYSHLQFSDAGLAYAAAQLSSYAPAMLSGVFADPTARSAYYDIYRYGLDQNRNAYSLLKEYQGRRPSYDERKNSTGSIWVRMRDQPLPFPAFTGEFPAFELGDYGKIPKSVRNLAGLDDRLSAEYRFISDPMSRFYDFELTRDGRNMFAVSKMRDAEVTEDVPAVQMYENPWIEAFPLNSSSGLTQTVDIRTKSTDSVDYIKSGKDYLRNPALSSAAAREAGVGVDNYAFLGTFLRKTSEIGLVYAEKHYAGQSQTLTGRLKVMFIDNGAYKSERDAYGTIDVSKQADGHMIFSYSDDNLITFAFLAGVSGEYRDFPEMSSSFDISANTAGAPADDFRVSEMTSHDMFEHDVAFVDMRLKGTELIRVDGSTNNMNADMSYIPAYPGARGETRVCDNAALSGEGDYAFELLGHSKQVGDYEKLVVKDADPYFDRGSFCGKYVFGRAYEDYLRHENDDNSFRVYSNASMNPRSVGYGWSDENSMPSVEINNQIAEFHSEAGDGYEWTIELSGRRYTEKNLREMQVFAYNTGTAGSNPYFIGSLSELSAGEVDAAYCEKSQYADTDVRSSTLGEDERVTVVGTYDRTAVAAMQTANRISGFNRITFKYDSPLSALKVRFYADPDVEDPYVRQDTVRVALFDDKDLGIFEYYHYLDAYGAVRLTQLSVPPDVLCTDWSFVFDREKMSEEGVLSGYRAYISAQSGAAYYLSGPGPHVELSDYSYLSDVYVFQGRRNLQFEYCDEDVFDIGHDCYYFPTLNMKYPRTAGTCMAERVNRVQPNALSGMFGDTAFVFDLLDAGRISSQVDEIEMPIQYNEKFCRRGLEMLTAYSDGVYVYYDGYGKYDTVDPAGMRCIHSYEALTPFAGEYPTAASAEIMASCESMLSSSIFIEEYEEKLSANGLGCGPKRQEISSVQSAESIYVYPDSVDLSAAMKLYANYSKGPAGLTLYFNYFNFIDTPFVRIDDNRVYPEIIPSSYLKLQPGETGVLDIVVQFKYYIDQTLYGVRTSVLASFRISNVSDDKPKFKLSRLRTAESGDFVDAPRAPKTRVVIADSELDRSAFPAGDYPQCQLSATVLTDLRLAVPYSFGICYPAEVLAVSGKSAQQYDVENVSPGYARVTVKDPLTDSMTIDVQSLFTAGQLSGYEAKYECFAADGVISGETGLAADIQYVDGSVVISAWR